MSKILEVIFKIFLDLIFAVVIIELIIVLYGGVQKYILKNEEYDYFGYTFFEVISGSMSGTIEVEDIIIVKTKNYDLKVGDIVTFKKNNDYITHRIIEINGDELLTKGDVNNTEDRPISKNDLLGKVVYIIPAAGVIKMTLFDPKVMISIVVTLLLFSACFEKNKKEKEEVKE